MRKRFPSQALLCLCFLVPPLSHAQFQEPTKEELQMTQDPKAPGADAVYFYREETTDDALHFHGYYERIKVLTEKGKEQATIRSECANNSGDLPGKDSIAAFIAAIAARD